jgi:hypothetical protein
MPLSLATAANGAVICPSVSSSQYDTVVICTQNQLATIFQDCDTFIGDIYIGLNWTGQFELPTLANITGFLWATGIECSYSGVGEATWNAGIPGLTNISATRLINLGSLSIYDANLLQSISLPILESISMVSIANVSSLQSVSLPSLESIDTLDINYASSLQSVSLGSLESMRVLSIFEASASTQLDFPSLLNVSNLAIGGIKSMYVNYSSMLFTLLMCVLAISLFSSMLIVSCKSAVAALVIWSTLTPSGVMVIGGAQSTHQWRSIFPHFRLEMV